VLKLEDLVVLLVGYLLGGGELSKLSGFSTAGFGGGGVLRSGTS